jgi:type II secretory pathway component PulF
MFFQRMGLSSAAQFSRRLGIGLRAGADLVRLLETEAKHGSSRQRDALCSVVETVKAGETVSEAMSKEAKFFPRLMVSLTRVGENAGKLERTFLTLADHYDEQVQLRRQFVSSIAWPVLQLVIGIGVISLFIYLMGVLQPSTGGQMEDMLGFGLRGASGVFVLWGYIALVAGVLFGIYLAFTRNLGGVQNLIPLLYLVPKLGPSLQTITLSRFTRTLALALSSGLDPIRSVKLSLDSTDSEYYRNGGEIFEESVREHGETLAGGLEATDLFPSDFLHLVEVAELSGTETESIDHLADQYQERARMAMRTITGVATAVVWVVVMGTLVFLILRIAIKVFGAYGLAAQPI